jgi:uncharacterized membrane protein
MLNYLKEVKVDPIVGLKIFLIVVVMIALVIKLYFGNGLPAILAQSIFLFSVILLTIIYIVGGKTLLTGLWGFNAGIGVVELGRMVTKKK